MSIHFDRVRQALDSFDFAGLFIEELGWSHPVGARVTTVEIDARRWKPRAIAQLAGVAVLEVENGEGIMRTS